MFAVRGSPADHDEWASGGCPGWSWDDVLPWYRKLEDDLDFADRPYHGSGGPYPVWRPPLDGWGVVDLAAREAALAAGHAWCEDHNAPAGTGASPYAASVRDGCRVSTNDAYLEPARGRDNLTIVGDALADRVVVEAGRAVAVEVIRNGRPERFAGGDAQRTGKTTCVSDKKAKRTSAGVQFDMRRTGILSRRREHKCGAGTADRDRPD